MTKRARYAPHNHKSRRLGVHAWSRARTKSFDSSIGFSICIKSSEKRDAKNLERRKNSQLNGRDENNEKLCQCDAPDFREITKAFFSLEYWRIFSFSKVTFPRTNTQYILVNIRISIPGWIVIFKLHANRVFILLETLQFLYVCINRWQMGIMLR